MDEERFIGTYKGIVCLINNRDFCDNVVHIMLGSTEDRPRIRLPIYAANCRLYWPK